MGNRAHDEADEFSELELAGIYARHRKLRGTDRLLYWPPEAACTALCCRGDNDGADHQCFLGPDHDGICVFSSECAARWPITEGWSNGQQGESAAVN